MTQLHLTIHLKDEDGEALIVLEGYPGYSCFGPSLAEALKELQISLPPFLDVVARMVDTPFLED